MRNNKYKRDIPNINERIRFPKVQLINHEGRNIGVVSRDVALQAAQDAELDLVLIAEQGSEGIPVVKIMDFGKATYTKKKKMAEAKKHQKTLQIKEIKIRPKIGEHDFNTKMSQAVQFLRAGKRLKVTLVFRGREMILRDEHGKTMFTKIDAYFKEADLVNIVQEKDSKMGRFWSRMYILKK